jgi:glutamate 5-kinase
MKGSGEIVPVVARITPEIEAMAGGTTSATAVGGMITKITAAKLATRSGCGVFIASGAEPDIVPRLLKGDAPGTFFVPSGLPLEAKKRWLAYFQRPTGTVHINACAVPVLKEQGRSLLAVGVTGASGDFAPGDVVNIAGPDGNVIARGKVQFGSGEIAAIAGKKGDAVSTLYPSRKRLEVVHRDDMALL